MRLALSVLAIGLSIILMACSDMNGPAETGAARATAETTAAPLPALDIEQLENILELKGTEKNGQFKLTVPQSELSVSVDGFRIIPPMGLTSWATFAPASDGAVVMGDLVVQEDEIAPVEKTLMESSLTISGLHNHFARDEPKAMFMHIHGTGPAERLARGVRATLERVKELRAAKNLQPQPGTVNTTFDPEIIESILGHSGDMNSGVYKITIGRPDVQLTDRGAAVTTFMGFNTWMAFQGTAERAAVSGDFTMLEREVAPVIEALVSNNIEVVAVHNHMVTEQPRIFFLHFWGVGAVEDLARGLKAGLDRTGSGTSAENTIFDFEDTPVGRLPSGWQVEATNPAGRLAQWSVVNAPGSPSTENHVLEVTVPEYERGAFNLFWTERISFQEGSIEVKVRAGTGEVDQGGGPIWRVRDRNNYYIARWNPLEDNFRIYYVKEGRRMQLDSATVELPWGEWHTIRIEHHGNRISGYLNGEKLLEVTDSTFPDAGGVGLWTKADASSLFDDLKIESQDH